MDSYEVLEREATLRAYLRDNQERIEMLEGCLDDLSGKLAKVCGSDLADQKVMRGLLDQTRMVTSTIRGYDKLIEMRMNMEAHRQASERHIAKLRAEQKNNPEASDLPKAQATTESRAPDEKNYSLFAPETIEAFIAEKKSRSEGRAKNSSAPTEEQKKFRTQLETANDLTQQIEARIEMDD